MARPWTPASSAKRMVGRAPTRSRWPRRALRRPHGNGASRKACRRDYFVVFDAAFSWRARAASRIAAMLLSLILQRASRPL